MTQCDTESTPIHRNVTQTRQEQQATTTQCDAITTQYDTSVTPVSLLHFKPSFCVTSQNGTFTPIHRNVTHCGNSNQHSARV